MPIKNWRADITVVSILCHKICFNVLYDYGKILQTSFNIFRQNVTCKYIDFRLLTNTARCCKRIKTWKLQIDDSWLRFVRRREYSKNLTYFRKTGCRVVHWLLTLYLLVHGNRSNDYLIAQLNADEIFSNVTLDI